MALTPHHTLAGSACVASCLTQRIVLNSTFELMLQIKGHQSPGHRIYHHSSMEPGAAWWLKDDEVLPLATFQIRKQNI